MLVLLPLVHSGFALRSCLTLLSGLDVPAEELNVLRVDVGRAHLGLRGGHAHAQEIATDHAEDFRFAGNVHAGLRLLILRVRAPTNGNRDIERLVLDGSVFGGKVAPGEGGDVLHLLLERQRHAGTAQLDGEEHRNLVLLKEHGQLGVIAIE